MKMRTAGTEDLMTIPELAQRLDLCEKGVRAGLRRGQIPHRKVGVRFLLSRKAIETWLQTAGLRPVSADPQ